MSSDSLQAPRPPHGLDQSIRVGYCANVFPGETLAETREALSVRMARVRDLVQVESGGERAAGGLFGVGLRVSGPAEIELRDPAAREAFIGLIRDLRMDAFTINGFPYGRFHASRVKEDVYRPDWLEPARAEYTIRLGGLMADLLPAGGEGSVSTAPLAFKGFGHGDAALDQMARNLADVGWEYETLCRERGVDLSLGLEPEPLCVIENVAETVAWFGRMLRVGGDHLARARGLGAAEAEEILRRRVGVCYDTCHMAVEFEDPAESLAALVGAGIRLSKIQVSSALRLRPTPEGLRELDRFADRVYLHQTLARFADGSISRWADIAPALAERDLLARAEELRVHCHVPLFMTRSGELESTSDFIPPVLDWLRGRNLVAHFELETYTWDVLPAEMRGGADDSPNDSPKDLIERHIAREIQWFNRIQSSSTWSPTIRPAASGVGSPRT